MSKTTTAPECGCLKEIDDKLREKNLRLSGYAFTFPEMKARAYVSCEWVSREKAPRGKRKSPPYMFASHCPFCGVKYPKLANE